MTGNEPERLIRWMLPHTQPERLPIEHKAQEDLAWAADRIVQLEDKLENLDYEIRRMRGLEDSYDTEEQVMGDIFLTLNRLCGN